MKTSYNNRQLSHLWANGHGLQHTGVRFKGSNMFFEGNLIYSYGLHFCAGALYTRDTKTFKMVQSDEKQMPGLKDGETAVLLSSRKYSNTTAKHLSYIRNAVSTGESEFVFYVPNPAHAQSSENTEYLFNHVIDALTDCLTANVKTVRAGSFLSIDTAWIKYADFMRCIGKTPEKIPSDLMNQAEIIWREARRKQSELFELNNTPEMKAKKEAAKARKEVRDAEKLKARAEKAELDFMNEGKLIPSELKIFVQNGTDLIRVTGDEVVTSRGARVPLAEAVKMLKAIKLGLITQGDTVGGFSFRQLTTGGAAVIGCHVVSVEHAEKVLKSYL
jgi:hypothetical protein